jgi:CheY-like chemotaxis protein
VAAGKPAQATVTVSARAAGSTVVIEVADDGPGIDEEALRATAVERGVLAPDAIVTSQQLLGLLFAPGFTTRAEVTETSGRGVGLDVVQTVVEDLGGAVEVRTDRGTGTCFAITLPVTLGVLRCLIARVGEERYALPVPGVVETVSLRDVEVHEVAGSPVLIRHGEPVPLVDLGGAVGAQGERGARAAIVVRYGGAGEQLAWAVDALEGELELVVKELGAFLGRLPAVSGATVDGDGSVVLVLDLRELSVLQVSGPGGGRGLAAVAAAPQDPARRAESAQRTPAGPRDGAVRVLVVDDSIGVRELQRVILEGAGYTVITAVDGLDGVTRLTGDPVDLVLSDVEMPGMDGFTFTRTIRKTKGWENVPVVIMTSRGGEADRRAGLDAGADAYLLKSEFDQHELLDVVRRLVGH